MQTNPTLTQRDLDLSERAYWVLKVGFVVAPVLAGLDKFFNYLTNWTNYLAPVFPNMLNISAKTFMQGVGFIEVIAGIGVLIKPKIFAYVVSAWLLGIIVNLFVLGNYYDLALRDLGLSIGSFALGQLSQIHEHVNQTKGDRVNWKRGHAPTV
ncbi:MAG: hypothetical protein NDI69_05295 [Bacteriovoracaceae bacterium]|nr:hypothetical protein [Bacteriovoracaceae bacterium]